MITQQFDVAYLTGVMNYLYGIPNLWARVARRRVGRPPPIFESRYGKTPGAFAPAEPGNFWFRWFPRDGIDGNYLAAKALSEHKLIQLRNALNHMIRIHQEPMAFKNLCLDMVIPILAKAMPRACFVFLRRDMLWNCHFAGAGPPEAGSGGSLVVGPAAEQILRTRKIIERDLRKSADGRFLEVEYEALCHAPWSVLSRLQYWLGHRGFIAFPDLRLPQRFPRTTKKPVVALGVTACVDRGPQLEVRALELSQVSAQGRRQLIGGPARQVDDGRFRSRGRKRPDSAPRGGRGVNEQWIPLMTVTRTPFQSD